MEPLHNRRPASWYFSRGQGPAHGPKRQESCIEEALAASNSQEQVQVERKPVRPGCEAARKGLELTCVLLWQDQGRLW